MSANDLFGREDRVYAETLRLADKSLGRAEQSLRAMHKSALSYEFTFELLESSISCLAKAGRKSVIEEQLANAEQHPLFGARSPKQQKSERLEN